MSTSLKRRRMGLRSKIRAKLRLYVHLHNAPDCKAGRLDTEVVYKGRRLSEMTIAECEVVLKELEPVI